MSDWISVNDDLPAPERRVKIKLKDGTESYASMWLSRGVAVKWSYYPFGAKYSQWTYKDGIVTHWVNLK